MMNALLLKKRNFIKVILLALFTIAFFASCKEKPKNPVAEYGNTMMNSYHRGKEAGAAANLDAVKRAVQAYRAANDRYPQSLEEIRSLLGGSEIDLSKYDYNPGNGSVSLKTL